MAVPHAAALRTRAAPDADVATWARAVQRMTQQANACDQAARYHLQATTRVFCGAHSTTEAEELHTAAVRIYAGVETAHREIAALLQPSPTEPELVRQYAESDAPAIDRDTIRADADRIARRVLAARRYIGDDATGAWARAVLKVRGQTTGGVLRRAADPYYWSRRFSRVHRRAYETAAIRRAPTRIRWCSNATAQAAQRRARETARWAEGLEMVADDGTIIEMADLLNEGARSRKQYAELLARAAGTAELAQRRGHKPVLFTITAPSEMHPMTTIGENRRVPNPGYDGTTPIDAHRWIARRWRTFTRRLARRGIGIEWVRGVHAHRDGTPHWHVALWAAPEHHATIEAYAREAFIARTEDGEDRYRHGLDMRQIEGGSRGAVAYLSRVIGYIARTVDGPDADEAARTTAWASTWGIRRYQTSHDRVTIWRMLRRRDLTIDDGGDGRRAQAAAVAGDYAIFIDAAGAAGLRIAYAAARNRYGEDIRRPVGVVDGDGVAYVRTRTWRQRLKVVGAATDAVILKDRGAGTRASVVILPRLSGGSIDRRPPPQAPPATDGGGITASPRPAAGRGGITASPAISAEMRRRIERVRNLFLPRREPTGQPATIPLGAQGAEPPQATRAGRA